MGEAATGDSALTAEQIDQYCRYIDLPAKYRLDQKPPLDIDLLTALHVHHISTCPYENLQLHYTTKPQISIEVDDLFKKLTKNGRGGYCMENTIFFHHVLRAYGFYVYMTGARARLRQDGIPQGDYIG
jgi:arylamine N-acetyltransferase